MLFKEENIKFESKAATPDQIKEYFHKYDLIVRQHQIPNENIFMMNLGLLWVRVRVQEWLYLAIK